VKDGELKAALERAEAAYEELLRTRAALGTMLAEAIKKDGGLREFRRHMEDLPHLIRSADARRTELKVELLGRRLKGAQAEHREATKNAKRAGATLEEAKKAYTRALNVEQRSSLEAQRLEALHREELERLERLRSDEAERMEENEVAAS
jgi:hypothetical protein